ncbi:MAG: NAD(P)-binding domain-containing protein [Ignavibacteriales bacterium]|nr:NAD(P)-binding domain-containing protein [Ignavibacteriales bacterium]
MIKKIGIIGSGTVGQTLANGFIKHQYEVMLGTNTQSKYEELKNKINNKARVGSFAETAAFGDMLIIATKGSAAEVVIKSIWIGAIKGKTIIDTTNPISDTPPVNGVIQYYTSPNESLMERLQKLAPGAKFVKAFSSIGSALMVNPNFGGMKPTMFFCGNDEGAKAEVKTILTQFGFEPEDMGKAEAARAIEPLAMLWCIPGFLNNQWMHAFKLLKK